MADIPVATCATAWTCPESGVTNILVFHQMLYFGDRLQHSLLCPNQMRDHGTIVQDTPTYFDGQSKHGITVYNDDQEESLFIPLRLQGVFSVFDTRAPTLTELEKCKHFVATSNDEWNPHSERFGTTHIPRNSHKRSSHHLNTPEELETIRSQYLDLLAWSRDLSVCSSSIDGKIYQYLAPDDPNDRLLRQIKSLRTISDIHWDVNLGKSAMDTDPGDKSAMDTDHGDRPRKRCKQPELVIPTELGMDDDTQLLNRKVSW